MIEGDAVVFGPDGLNALPGREGNPRKLDVRPMISFSTIGTTRQVLIVGPWAIKLARGDRGRRCNLYEANLFRTVDDRRRPMLCPVHWCSGDGQVFVMASARPLSAADHEDLLDTDGFPDWDYMRRWSAI
jgi:hypothetical protein